MTQIASIDWDVKRYYLHADTVISGFDIALAYDEARDIVASNAANEQGYSLFIEKRGKDSKGGGSFTQQYGFLASGWLGVPYDQVSHSLVLLREIVSADELSDKDTFDRSGIVVEVDIDTDYDKTEIVVISVGGSALTQVEHDKLISLPSANQTADAVLDELSV